MTIKAALCVPAAVDAQSFCREFYWLVDEYDLVVYSGDSRYPSMREQADTLIFRSWDDWGGRCDELAKMFEEDFSQVIVADEITPADSYVRYVRWAMRKYLAESK